MDLSKYYDQLTPLPVENIEYLVVHHSASSPNLTIEDIHQMHLNLGWICVGYHVVILRDGTIQYGRPMEYMGAQVEGFNNRSLGVCLIGYFHKDSVNQGQYPDKPTDEQLTSLVEVLTNWKKKIPQKVEIVGHRQLNATSCPGDGMSHLTIEGIAKKVDNAIKHEKPVAISLPPKTVKDKHYTELVQKYATQYNLRVEFVHSIIKQESDYNPCAISKSGASGLMQILPTTAKDIAEKLCMENVNLQDPEQNIHMGCYYLSWCKNNLDLEWCIACGYNQGIGHFKRGTMPVDGLNYANEVKKRIYSE
jgi:hypothetical protein